MVFNNQEVRLSGYYVYIGQSVIKFDSEELAKEFLLNLTIKLLQEL
jgi:hypothetical protein